MSIWILAVLIIVLIGLRTPVGLAFLGPSVLYMLLEGNSAGLGFRQAS